MSDDTKDVKDIKPAVYASPFPPGEEERLTIPPNMANHNVWALKVPRFLLDKWEQVKEPGVELGSLIVDNSTNPPTISLKLPVLDENASAEQRAKVIDATHLPDQFTVDVPPERSRNSYIFSEKKRSWASSDAPPSKRKKEKAHPELVAKVMHEATVRPVRNEKYLRILRQRQLESAQSRRPIIQLESTGISKGKQNQLASGFANASSHFGKGLVSVDSRAKSGEKRARLERGELIDRIFSLYNDKPYWGLPALRQTLDQPDAWLREILRDIAEPITSGPYANMYQLKQEWKDKLDEKPDLEDEDEDEEDDEDDEMEEVI